MAVQRHTSPTEHPLTGVHRRVDYNDAEGQFSLLLQARLEDLLQGRRDHLDLLRRYPNEPDRLGVIAMPPGFPRAQLRLPIVEKLALEVLHFVSDDAVGGPVTQSVTPDGCTIEVQTFATRYPHIVIERTDRYAGDRPDPVETGWRLQRVQNQHSEIHLNRVLDVGILAFELLRLVR